MDDFVQTYTFAEIHRELSRDEYDFIYRTLNIIGVREKSRNRFTMGIGRLTKPGEEPVLLRVVSLGTNKGIRIDAIWEAGVLTDKMTEYVRERTELILKELGDD